MTVRAVELDIERAVMLAIQDQVAADGIVGVNFNTLLSGAPGQEPEYPYVYVMCEPLTHMGGTLNQWEGTISVEIRTKHTTGNDRDAATLGDIFSAVAYTIENADFSTKTERVASLQLRRTGGGYFFEEATNTLEVSAEIVKACGSK